MTIQLKNELRYGGRFLFRDNPALTGRVAAELAANETLDEGQLAQYGKRHLHATLQRAIKVLPYYAHISRDFGIDESEQVLREAFPIIDKATLLVNRETLYPNGGVKKVWQALAMTSGSTGTPLEVFRCPRSVLYENEFVKRHWRWAGFRPGMKRATLRGDMVVGLDKPAPPYWFYNRYNNQLLLSSRHLNDDCIDAIIDTLDEFAPDMLQAYPSAAHTLASYLERRGRKLRIPVVFSSSEPMYPHQRKSITTWLAQEIMELYGMCERVAIATQCELGSMHLNPDYSHVEIVDGFVVGTTYHNHAMPLVRYRMSDQTRWKHGRCACGRAFPMIEDVTGKYEDSITGSNGAVVSPTVLTFAFDYVEHIRRSQVAQIGPAHWQVRVLPYTGFGPADQQKIVDNIHALVDAGVQVDVVVRAELPNTAAGKFRWVVNET